MLRVGIFSTVDIGGGAARAAYRLHQSLTDMEMDSRLYVDVKRGDDPSVQGAEGLRGRISHSLRDRTDAYLDAVMGAPPAQMRSVAVVPGPMGKALASPSIDLVNLHWVTRGGLSIAQIGRIDKPLVWTLHDMWPFSGPAHYTLGAAQTPPGGRVRFFDAHFRSRKMRHLQRPLHAVAPSRWIANRLMDSSFGGIWHVSVVPNAVPIATFAPVDKGVARQLLSIPTDRPVVLFGAADPMNQLKGLDLLERSLTHVGRLAPDTLAVVVGAKPNGANLPLDTKWLGQLNDDVLLRLAYGAADVVAVPSRLDNLPQVATEAQACGRPVVAFNVGGLPDTVVHGETGYLAEPFDTLAFGEYVASLLTDDRVQEELGRNARSRAVQLWSPSGIAKAYVKIFAEELGSR